MCKRVATTILPAAQRVTSFSYGNDQSFKIKTCVSKHCHVDNSTQKILINVHLYCAYKQMQEDSYGNNYKYIEKYNVQIGMFTTLSCRETNIIYMPM